MDFHYAYFLVSCFAQFLSDRTQVVAFGGNKSTSRRLLYGVPHGSVLGPLLFALYSADVIRIAAKHGVCIHAYADDLQIYISCAASDQNTTTSRLLTVVSDIDRWMSSNRLKLNAGKTEVAWLDHSSATREAQYVTTADQEPGHHASRQGPRSWCHYRQQADHGVTYSQCSP